MKTPTVTPLMLEGWMKPKLFTKAMFQQCECIFKKNHFSVMLLIFLSSRYGSAYPNMLGTKKLGCCSRYVSEDDFFSKRKLLLSWAAYISDQYGGTHE
jgi:hypothetical protein